MPLPEPIYPPYAPRSFMEEGGAELVNLSAQLFWKYNPGALQQAQYAAFLADEEFIAASDAKKLEYLQRERKEISANLARFREVGLGAQGSAAGARGRSGRYGSSASSALEPMLEHSWHMSDIEATRRTNNLKITGEERRTINELYSINDMHNAVIEKIMTGPISEEGTSLTSAEVYREIDTVLSEAEKRFSTAADLPMTQKKHAASYLYERVRAIHPALMTNPDGGPSNFALALAEGIDRRFHTDGLVFTSVANNLSPSDELRKEQVAMIGAARGAGPGFFESAARGVIPDDWDKDGIITPEEKSRTAEEKDRRGALGIPEPMDQQEQAFLTRYIEALRDDGKATREELGEDYDVARAAYEKGRMVERLPRGMAAFYDESYLRGLARLSQVEGQMAEITDRPTPQTAAARRTLGLPHVPPEALAAAASVSPLAAESLPWALKRVQDSGGLVEPRGRVEKFTQSLINVDVNRDFNSIVQAVNKEYPNDPDRRLEAFAYYGAFNYMVDTRDQTLAQGPAKADVRMAATEAQQFEREVAPRPMNLPELTPLEQSAPGLFPELERKGEWYDPKTGRPVGRR